MTNRKACVTRRELVGGVGAAVALSLAPRAARATDDFGSLVRVQMAAARIPGLAVGIARNGEVAFARGYGLADIVTQKRVTTETMFHIASITKTITASAVMLLVEKGLIALDEPVAPHLDFAIAGDHARAITFRHLLMHTSGISDETYYQIDFRSAGADATMTLGDLLRAYLAPGGAHVGAGNAKQVPGMRWDYCNIGYALLGYLVERVGRQDMRDLTRDRLFRPLGLRRITWTIADTPVHLRVTPYDIAEGTLKAVQPVGFPDWPTGMIRSSIHDLTLLVGAAANAGVANGMRLLGPKSISAMLDMQKPAGLPDWLTGQGLGWQESMLDGVPRVNHWGGDPGVFTMAYLDPVRRSGVAILSNLSAAQQSRDALKAITAHALQYDVK